MNKLLLIFLTLIVAFALKAEKYKRHKNKFSILRSQT